MHPAIAPRTAAAAPSLPFGALSGAIALPARLSGRPLRLLQGGSLYEAGAAVREVYKVISGSIGISRLLPDGRRLVTAFALPGEVFGIEASGIHRQFAEATAESVVIAFTLDDINAWIAREPAAASYWLRVTLGELELAQDRCVLLGRKTAGERVASFLLDLDRRIGRSGDIIPLPMSRYDIADHLGLTAETVSRVFSDFRKRRIMADDGLHQLWLLDRAALQQQAHVEAH